MFVFFNATFLPLFAVGWPGSHAGCTPTRAT